MVTAPRESSEMIGSMPRGHTCLDLRWQPRKAEKKKNSGVLAGVTDCGKSRKWGCRGRLVLGFKPRRSSHAGWLGPHGFGVLPFATWLPFALGRRDLAGKKRGERTLAGGTWEGATWFWINWRSRQQHSRWCWN